MRQVYAEVMGPNLPARDVVVSLAEIRPGVAQTISQRHKHVMGSRRRFRHILTHDRMREVDCLNLQ